MTSGDLHGVYSDPAFIRGNTVVKLTTTAMKDVLKHPRLPPCTELSVGSNNAARSHALSKFTRRKCSRSFLSFFISYLVALFTERTWFSSNNTSGEQV